MSEAVPPPDVVDRAAAAVRATPVPDAPAELMAAVTLSVAARARVTRRRKLMRYATVCGVLAAVGVGTALLSGGGSAQARLMDALKKQEKAKTYKAVQTVVGAGPGVSDGGKTIYYAGTKGREEQADGQYVVTDAATGTMAVNPAGKWFAVVNRPAIAPKADFYALAHAAAKKAIADGDRLQNLGAKVVNGRQLKGYKFTRDPVNDVTPSVTFWLDPAADTLVRYEAVTAPMFMIAKPDGTSAVVKPEDVRVAGAVLKSEPVTVAFEFADFDKPLDPKLFDAIPPAGYEDRSAQFKAMAAAAPAKKPADPAKR